MHGGGGGAGIGMGVFVIFVGIGLLVGGIIAGITPLIIGGGITLGVGFLLAIVLGMTMRNRRGNIQHDVQHNDNFADGGNFTNQAPQQPQQQTPRPTKCPNCGGALGGNFCQFCGTQV